MANTTALSNINAPAGVLTPGGGAGGDGGGSGRIALGSLFRPMKGVMTPDPVNGPLVSDTLIVTGEPSMTGRTLYGWNAVGAFNLQSQNWVEAPDGAGFNTSAYTAAGNFMGPRVYGSTAMDGFPLESNIDFGFVTESMTVTVLYFNYGGATGNGYHDMQMYVEDETTGNLKKTVRMPATKTATGLHYRTLTFSEARNREFRVMLAMNSWIVGVIIESQYTIRRSANKLFLCTNGDSWNEPWGSVLATPVGGSYPTATFRTAYTSQMLAEATGAAIGLFAQSGTGYFNAGAGSRAAETAIYNQGTFNNCSVFLGASRMENFIGKVGDRNPILMTIGGWNDGAIVNSPVQADYATRVTSGIERVIALKEDIQMLFVGIQPVSSSYTANHAASNLGIKEAVEGAPQENMVGFLDEWNMWLNKTMSGQRGNNVNSSDQIHLHSKGAEMVANWWTASMREMTIPLDYYLGMLDYVEPVAA